MFDAVTRWLFDGSGLTPHGFCLLWQPGLLWTYALSDAVIGLAYFSIPVALAVIAQERRDLVFRPLLLLFAAFILLCGATHFLDVVTLWVPAYGVQAIVKAMTAIVSIFTAIAMWALLPQAIKLPSPAQLRDANAALLEAEERLRQSQKMEIVGQLTGGLAHDFNNMIQAIGGGLTVLERRIATGRLEEIGRIAEEMRRSLNTTAGLTDRLLAFSRRQTLRPTRIEPDTFIAGMQEFLQRTLGPEVKLALRLGDGKSDIEVDAHQLEAVLLNLAINARDAMPEGGLLVIEVSDRSIRAGEVSDPDPVSPGSYVQIKVTDTGIGMTPDVLARAFEPFYTTKPHGHGTGLGLSQVYGFVRQSGGFSRIESRPGAGTSIFICLPGQPRAKPDEAPQAQREPDRPELRSARGVVLVVEDQDEVRRQIVEVLGDLGCEVIEAADGLEALNIVESRRTRLDLLITDVGLPGLNGRQLADATREIRPGLPILLITGYAGRALDTIKIAEGTEILRKPFLLEELAARVKAMLMARSLGAPDSG
jgi:signal transduction histidine kinase/CheY-like chemotaxis protein